MLLSVLLLTSATAALCLFQQWGSQGKETRGVESPAGWWKWLRTTAERVVFFMFSTKEVFFGVTHLTLLVGYVKDWKLC